jgi:hypothetical protein
MKVTKLVILGALSFALNALAEPTSVEATSVKVCKPLGVPQAEAVLIQRATLWQPGDAYVVRGLGGADLPGYVEKKPDGHLTDRSDHLFLAEEGVIGFLKDFPDTFGLPSGKVLECEPVVFGLTL